MELNLKRPVVFFDLETTGTNITRDRIVEISIIKVWPDGHELERTRRINPEMPIPAEATAVHHITDADVAPGPTSPPSPPSASSPKASPRYSTTPTSPASTPTASTSHCS